MFLDLAMPGFAGLDLIPRLDADGCLEVVVVSGVITVRNVVEAMKLGAFECVSKSDSLEALELIVRKAGEAHRRKRDLERASRYVSHQNASGPDFIARSPRLTQILEVLRDVAASNVSVLLTGESGTGKDVLA